VLVVNLSNKNGMDNMETDPERIELQTSAIENSPLMTPEEVAKVLRVHRSWVYAHQQDLPGLVRLGRYVRFRRIAIEEFLRQKFPCQ